MLLEGAEKRGKATVVLLFEYTLSSLQYVCSLYETRGLEPLGVHKASGMPYPASDAVRTRHEQRKVNYGGH
jgi:hypothetical protein